MHSLPCPKLWNLNSCFSPKPNCEVIKGVEAYEYPSGLPNPLNTIGLELLSFDITTVLPFPNPLYPVNESVSCSEVWRLLKFI